MTEKCLSDLELEAIAYVHAIVAARLTEARCDVHKQRMADAIDKAVADAARAEGLMA